MTLGAEPDGKAVVPVSKAGSYTVTIDEEALPAETGYPRPSTNPAQVEVFDGGADGLASTNPNTVFARQGIFVP